MDNIEDNKYTPPPPPEEDLNVDEDDDDDDELSMAEDNSDREKTSYGGKYLDERMKDFSELDTITESDNLEEFLKDKPEISDKLKYALADLEDTEDEQRRERKFREYKNILLDNIDAFSFEDRLNPEAWEKLQIEEHKKLDWEQKIKNINNALQEENATIDPDNKNVYDFISENIDETFTEKRKEINGYTFEGKKIIKRNREKNFVFEDNDKSRKFIQICKDLTAISARTLLVDVLSTSDNVEITAMDCLNDLRNQERMLVSRSNNTIELKEIQPGINELDTAINDLKQNKKTNIREGVIRRTLEGRILSLKNWVKENKTTLGIGGTSFLLTMISGIATTIPILNKLKNGVKSISHMGDVIEKVGKKIKNMGRQLDNFLNAPTKGIGSLVMFLGKIIKEIRNIPLINIILPLAFIFLVYYLIIKIWRGR